MLSTESIDENNDEGRVYKTRLRGRQQNIERKYDDIFSSVVTKALTTSEAMLSSIYVQKKPRRKYNSVSYTPYVRPQKVRSVSECDSLGNTDSSPDSDSTGSQSPSVQSDDQEHSDETILRTFSCICGERFEKHSDLHEHMIEHPRIDRSICSTCGVSAKWLRKNNVCRICMEYIATSIEEHMQTHYRDRSGKGALMECRHCYKSFGTVRDVREHERKVHRNRLKNQRFLCQYCYQAFESRHSRDNHLMTHFDSSETSCSEIWSRISLMQETMTDNRLIHQCPMCRSVMSSKKSFRLHVIQKHLLRDSDRLISSLGLPTVTEVQNRLFGRVKVEVKEEIMEESRIEISQENTSVVKEEPIE